MAGGGKFRRSRHNLVEKGAPLVGAKMTRRDSRRASGWVSFLNEQRAQYRKRNSLAQSVRLSKSQNDEVGWVSLHGSDSSFLMLPPHVLRVTGLAVLHLRMPCVISVISFFVLPARCLS